MSNKSGNEGKIILDLCGGTGEWNRPFWGAGYDVRLITLPTLDVTQWRTNGILDVINTGRVYGILAAPPCTMFSHVRTVAKEPRDVKEAMKVVTACLEIIWECQYNVKTGEKKTKLKFWALENPQNGILHHFLGRPAFSFNPYEFGDMYKKKTALWGHFNEPIKTNLKPFEGVKFDRLKTKEISPDQYGKLSRTERRAITPAGFAQAFYEANK